VQYDAVEPLDGSVNGRTSTVVVSTDMSNMADGKKSNAVHPEGIAPPVVSSDGGMTFFSYLAICAHKRNVTLWTDMERCVDTHLRGSPEGQKIKQLESFENKGYLKQGALLNPGCVNVASALGSEPAFGNLVDEHVYPGTLHVMATVVHPKLVAAMKKMLDMPANHNETASYKFLCDAAVAIKKPERSSVKVGEYRDEQAAGGYPYAQNLTDPLRTTVLCNDAASMMELWNKMQNDPAFKVIRLKNKIATNTKPFNMHINAIFSTATTAPMVIEVQLVFSNVYKLFKASHAYYSISRAPNVAALAKGADETHH